MQVPDHYRERFAVSAPDDQVGRGDAAAEPCRSRFRTWLYRLVVNHVLNMKRGGAEQSRWTFRAYGRALDATPDMDIPDPHATPVDERLLVEEAQISCTSGMLLCLDRPQRMVYVLGEIFGVTDAVGSELFEISPENFRQRLARARRDLHRFMHDQCGLVNTANPCRCAKKTQGFIQAGYVDPKRLLFVSSHVCRVHEVALRVAKDLGALDEAYARIHRDHPFQEPPDFVSALRRLVSQERFQSLLGRTG